VLIPLPVFGVAAVELVGVVVLCCVVWGRRVLSSRLLSFVAGELKVGSWKEEAGE
jgi:hypothetical protein